MTEDVKIRYPDDWFMPSLADAKEARASAGRVMEWIRKILPDIFV
jgi:HEPN domain-containing protein